MRKNTLAIPWRTLRESMWGLLAGLVGSLCCIGPSAAILLGLGSSSALFGLHVDQRLALVGGVMVLAVGGVLALRRTRTCAIRRRSRWQQLALILATGVVTYCALGILAPRIAAQQEDAAIAAVRPAAAAPVLRHATLLVEKMNCPPCAAHLRGLLARKPFIQHYTAQTGDEQVTIVYDSRRTDLTSLLHVIPANYGVSLVSDAPAD